MGKQDYFHKKEDEEERKELQLLYEMGNRISFIEDQIEKMNGIVEEAMEAIKRKDLEIELLKQMQSKGCTSFNEGNQATKTRSNQEHKINTKYVPPINPMNPLEIWIPSLNQESEAELNFTGIQREAKKPSRFIPNESAPSITSVDSAHSLKYEDLVLTKDLESQVKENQIFTRFDESSDDLINRYLNGSKNVERGRIPKRSRFKKVLEEPTRENSNKSVQEFIYFLNERKIFSTKANNQPDMVNELNNRCKSLVTHALSYSAERKPEKKSGNGKLIVQIKISNAD